MNLKGFDVLNLVNANLCSPMAVSRVRHHADVLATEAVPVCLNRMIYIYMHIHM